MGPQEVDFDSEQSQFETLRRDWHRLIGKLITRAKFGLQYTY